LPTTFTEAAAAAIVATACPVPDRFAASFARKFYELFVRDKLQIGEALRQTRLFFLTKDNNPLGLAYGLYSPAHYRVALVQAAGDAPR
jgi:CHAT domain-containing protein